jgi:glycosyltransferase involved in cell wall biosynthesis
MAAEDPAPEISVILCTYDRPAALARCLDSLVAQRVSRPVEIVVVDNHPQSGRTAALLARYPSVRWLADPIAGLSQARNTGIRAARGQVLVATDDDVIAPPEWLETLTAPLFSGDPTLGATTGNCLALKQETAAEQLFEAYGGLRHGEQAIRFDRRWLDSERLFFPQLWRIGTTANAAFRASVFADPRVGLFDTQLGVGTPVGAWEDLYCFYLMLRGGYAIQYLPQAVLRHAHREQMPALIRQLEGYRRGETAFLVLMLLRHGDLRAIGQMLFWIPRWRLALYVQEILRRLRGQRKFSLRIFWVECVAYLRGPMALWRSWPRKDTTRG